jgi:hypothetical protein
MARRALCALRKTRKTEHVEAARIPDFVSRHAVPFALRSEINGVRRIRIPQEGHKSIDRAIREIMQMIDPISSNTQVQAITANTQRAQTTTPPAKPAEDTVHLSPQATAAAAASKDHNGDSH